MLVALCHRALAVARTPTSRLLNCQGRSQPPPPWPGGSIHFTGALFSRSGDMGLGIPFNIASYSFLTHLLAHHCFLQPKELIHFVGNAHIYSDHINPLKKQLNREIYAPPNIFINKRRSIIDHYIFDDFIIQNYIHHSPIEMNMRL